MALGYFGVMLATALVRTLLNMATATERGNNGQRRGQMHTSTVVTSNNALINKVQHKLLVSNANSADTVHWHESAKRSRKKD